MIDSRTGHTDTGGICTRQLPDAVAIFFFPNEQNLRGLTKVVRDIRAEASEPRNKEIDLHFVMSNVPDLDDEDRILEDKIESFQRQLEFRRELAVVHRYDSLSLLNQIVFTKDRPRSRLSREYRNVVREIVRRNLVDREGALDYILQAGRRVRRQGTEYEPLLKIDQRLLQIDEMHSSDGEVLFRLGVLRENERQLEKAALLFDRAIEAGYDEPEAYLRRARVRASNDDPDGASEDALRVLQSDHLPPSLVREAMLLAGRGDLRNVAESKVVGSLDPGARIWLAKELNGSPEEIKAAVSILEPLVGDDDLLDEDLDWARHILGLAYIGIGKCADAVKLLLHEGRDVGEMEIVSAFNYGMALWGERGDVVAAPFARAVKINQADPKRQKDPNYLQCLAVAFWAAGDAETARDFVRRSREAVGITRDSLFSCWRYHEVAARVFLDDLDEILELIGGDTSRIPRFMLRSSGKDELGS